MELLAIINILMLGKGAVLGIVLAIYFVPTCVACLRRHPKMFWIFVANILVGWTVIGWIVLLIWAREVSNNDVKAPQVNNLENVSLARKRYYSKSIFKGFSILFVLYFVAMLLLAFHFSLLEKIFSIIFLICVIWAAAYSWCSEIEIDNEGIVFYVKRFNIKQPVLWQDVSSITTYPGIIKIWNKQDASILVSYIYKDAEELIDKVNSKFPFKQNKRIKDEIRSMAFWGPVFFIPALFVIIVLFFIALR